MGYVKMVHLFRLLQAEWSMSRLPPSMPIDHHAGSDPSALQLVERYLAQAAANGITPVLKLTHAN